MACQKCWAVISTKKGGSKDTGKEVLESTLGWSYSESSRRVRDNSKKD